MHARKADALPQNISLGAKVAFLSRRDSYSPRRETVRRIETHMSWVFLVGDRAYKLKKPVRFDYLDYSPSIGVRPPAVPRSRSIDALRHRCTVTWRRSPRRATDWG